MCLFKHVKDTLKAEKVTSNAKDARNPIETIRCPHVDCPEHEMIFDYFVQFLGRNIKESIDGHVNRPIKEKNFAKDAKTFSELERVVFYEDLTFEKKVRLLSIPTVDRIRHFLKDLFTFTTVKAETIVYQIIILRRFMKHSQWSLRAANWRSLIITSLRVALKLEQNLVVSTKVLSHVYPLFKPEEYVKCENAFLKILNWDLWVSTEQYMAQLSSALRTKSSA
mmetsp:Transcript_45066/g.51776  ORF Transcript_45066/g.51776 Transcript_45066/m.51776 type:complete len:223 (+) Transcript_45066:108-776(+)